MGRALNLQFFAEEKTEKATPRRRYKARERGQVFSSRELTSALILLIAVSIIKALGPKAFHKTMVFFTYFFEEYLIKHETFSISSVYRIFLECISFVARLLCPMLISVFFISLLSNFMQVGYIFSLETISFKLERINPLDGVKRIFSKRSLVELLKSIVKIFIIGYTVYLVIKKNKDIFPMILDMELKSSLVLMTDLVFNVGVRATLALLVLSIFDYFYQWYEYELSLKMSKEDIKEEYKEVEGNPQIKSRIRQVQRQLARGRMMKDVERADVVITNPTHLAVALKYNPVENIAPVVLAKGEGILAEKIKQIASDENILIVEDKPLAQILYKTTEIGDIIPEHLYNAVAEVLALVYSLKEGSG